MRLTPTLKRRALAINMTPMIDIVFLLLIFFITCSQVSEANREAVELPKLKGSEDQAPSEIIVNIDAAGEINVAGEVVTVPELIALCVDDAQRLHGNDPGALMIVVRADRRGECRTLNQVVDAFTRLGVRQVRFAVLSQP